MSGAGTSTTSDGLALVTGGARGIGFGIARRLAQAGRPVGILDLNEDAATASAAELSDEGLTVAGYGCDVSDYDAFCRVVAEVADRFGPVHTLVNNAGWSPNMRFLDTSIEDWQKIIGVNFLGVLNGCRAVLEEMIARESGRIVNISSDAARVGTPREAVYAGAKAGVIGFSKSLAAEVARHQITVNVVCPSTTDTPLLRSLLSKEQLERRTAGNPMGRIGRPEDLAEAVAFFASEGAGYITGQVLSVNGGSSRVG